jgi:Class II Aldolase and Adducin N-terminal domain
MLVKNPLLGSILASHFSSNLSYSTETSSDHTIVLMPNHGFTTLGASIEEVVYRAMYTQTNVRIQANTITLAAMGGGNAAYLSGRQRVDCGKADEGNEMPAWTNWVREVETLAGGLYRNDLGSPLGN